MPPFRAIQQKLRFSSDQILLSVGKTLAISVLILYMLFIFISNSSSCKPSEISPSLKQIEKSQKSNKNDESKEIKNPPTNISNIVFGISGSINAWKSRKSYVESWWVPNVTRGYIFFDKPPTKDFLPWPTTSPPFRVSENASKFEVYKRHVKPFVIRIVRAVLETFREGNHENARWFVMGDDDTIFFLENLVSVLRKYDHTKYYYIGGISECTKSNFDFSFEMAYGGGGFALSYPLAAALVKNLDMCIDRYPYLHVSDQIMQYCIADLGVSLTPEKGFHQIDLVHDISGLLSAHPQSPLVTLHHLDIVLPIFPTLDRHASLKQLMKAARVDQPRTLQQTICYDKTKRWSFSVSWGYSAHIYEQVIPRSILKKPLETFTPWSLKPKPPDYMFNTRFLSRHPCDAPHVFFFKSIAKNVTSRRIVTTYLRSLPRGLPQCIPGGNFSANHISRVIVYSPTTKFSQAENRGECCDVVHATQMNTTAVKFRACSKDEIVA